MIRPSFEEFQRLSQGERLVPVWGEMPADMETPASAYWKIAHDAERSFLLESVTGGEQLARYSFIGSHPSAVIRSKGRCGETIRGECSTSWEVCGNETPLSKLKKIVFNKPYAEVEDLPRFTGGAVGFIAYDMVRFFERLPELAMDDLNCDDMCMLVCDTVIAFDHAKNRILVISHADDENSYEAVRDRIGRIMSRLAGPLPQLPTVTQENPSFECNMSRDAYEASVAKTVRYIEAGDGVQMVISQRWSAETNEHPVNVYRRLRSINPSPYMYLLRLGNCDVVGASPEVLVTMEDDKVRVRPIAGTRQRGRNQQEDADLERELLADAKERAEHLMLVDLGRNDVGRIALPGTVTVNELMVIERYSHVMHIVSDVTGVVRPDLDAFDVFSACFPAGTVSGAPKVRAMEIIEELEPTRRGLYAGAVGYFGFNGDMDMAIAIRTVFMKDGKAHIQAGAGIVFDSLPEREWEECRRKATAVMKALQPSSDGLP